MQQAVLVRVSSITNNIFRKYDYRSRWYVKRHIVVITTLKIKDVSTAKKFLACNNSLL